MKSINERLKDILTRGKKTRNVLQPKSTLINLDKCLQPNLSQKNK